VEEVTKLLEALGKLVGVLGATQTVLLVAAIIAYSLYRDFRERKHSREVEDEKERTIQRIAEENRTYRRYFFKLQGMSIEEIDKMMGEGSRPLPLDSKTIGQLPAKTAKK